MVPRPIGSNYLRRMKVTSEGLPQMEPHLVLVGPMASGKTTLGRLLAGALGRPFIDSDDQIVALYGVTGGELAARESVEALHSAEAQALVRAIATEDPTVIAAAASVADSQVALSALAGAEATLVLLESPIATLMDRLDQARTHRRPISADELVALNSRRRSALEALDPDLVVDTSRSSPEAIVDQILNAISAPRG